MIAGSAKDSLICNSYLSGMSFFMLENEATEMAMRNETNVAVADRASTGQEDQGQLINIPEAFKIGEILVTMNVITREQLKDALLMQKLSQNKRLGELLHKAGYAQPHQIDHGLRIQQKLLAAALAAAISLSPVSASQGSGFQGAHSCSAKINVTANVIAVASVKILRQMSQVIVTSADVARGYVEVKSASLIEVKNNSPRGFLLIFQLLDDAFKEVCVYGLENEVQISLGGGWIAQQYKKVTVPIELSFRFMLGENALPGTYAWPLFISAQPL